MSPPAMRDPFGLLLVELIPDEPEREARTQAYPFLAGLSRAAGWRLWWRALGVPNDPTMRARLSPGDLRLLLGEAARLRPSAIVVNEMLREDQRRALAGAARGARVVYCSLELAEDLPNLGAFVRRHIRRGPAALLGAPDLIERLTPVFSREVLNGAPWAKRPIVRVVAGRYCSFRTRAADNPLYRGLRLRSKALACSFCRIGAQPAGGRRMRNPLAFAARQIEAACKEECPAGAERRFELSGSELWRRIDVLIAALVRRGVRDAELTLMPRIDELLERRGAIRRSLALMASSGLALRPYGMGVENFSAAENLRLNKGVTADQVHEAAAFLMETAARWPRQFRLGPGGLSMILFTPWTSLDDLRVNFEHIERCPLVDRSFAVGRRLQLFPELPITALARREGLAPAPAGEHFYNCGCITAVDTQEIPWRFLHPEVGVLWQLGRRLSSNRSRVPAGDPDSGALEAFLAGSPRRGPFDPLPLMRRAVDAVASDPRLGSVSALLDRLS